MPPIVLLIAITLINTLLIPFGILYNFGKSIYESVKYSFIEGVVKFFLYWFLFFVQIKYVFNYLCWHLAFAQDLFLNAVGGEMIEDCTTTSEDSLFGVGNCPVSAAIGYEQEKQKIVPFGKEVSSTLDVLGKNHCSDAIKMYRLKQQNNIKY